MNSCSSCKHDPAQRVDLYEPERGGRDQERDAQVDQRAAGDDQHDRDTKPGRDREVIGGDRYDEKRQREQEFVGKIAPGVEIT